ncbi:hypothetical protein [Halobacillus litoralis]|uniref:hypothetical protein n=1 Tax=Halobacillus litoralis TaxID=45668 RepID=UPI001371118E|nr:hypothetical protein [Halobacillus litoralis]MYL39637.1 hypothetical protein [Halobacillus litoralis]
MSCGVGTFRLSADACRGHSLSKGIFGSRCSRRRHHRTLLVPVPVENNFTL